MCFRFLQVAWSISRAPASCRTTTKAHVEGVERQAAKCNGVVAR